MEIVTKADEWSALKAGIISVSLENSSLRFIIPEEWFYLKVYDFFVGFFILQISHKSYSYLSSKSFATYFCFNEGLPPFVCSLLLKNTLR